jgi:hypothetical protein
VAAMSRSSRIWLEDRRVPRGAVELRVATN